MGAQTVISHAPNQDGLAVSHFPGWDDGETCAWVDALVCASHYQGVCPTHRYQAVISNTLTQREVDATMGRYAQGQLSRNDLGELARTFGRLARRRATLRLRASRAPGVSLAKITDRPAQGPDLRRSHGLDVLINASGGLAANDLRSLATFFEVASAL